MRRRDRGGEGVRRGGVEEEGYSEHGRLHAHLKKRLRRARNQPMKPAACGRCHVITGRREEAEIRREIACMRSPAPPSG